MLPSSNMFVAVFGTYVLISCTLLAFGVWEKVWPPEFSVWKFLPRYMKIGWYSLVMIFLIGSTLLADFLFGY